VGGPADELGIGDLLAGFLDRVLPVAIDWRKGLASRFDRETVAPGLGYQFGLGGVGSFRLIDGDTAATVTDRSGFGVRSGFRLGTPLTLEAGYRTDDVDVLDTRSNRTVRDRVWPDVRVRYDDTDGVAGTPVERLVLALGVLRNTREVTFGGAASQRRSQEDVQFPVEVTVGWASLMTLRYTGSLRTGKGIDPTGNTEREENLHSLSLNSSFLAPAWLGVDPDRQVQLAAIASYQDGRECRVSRFRSGCVAFVDQITRALSLRLSTDVSGFDVGLQGSWNERQSFVGRRLGSTQFQLSLTGQFLFQAGPSPASLTGR
jgi:hypothetical protein